MSRDRRFQRITMDALLELTFEDGQTIICRCVDFSEDGIDVMPSSEHTKVHLKIGMIVQIQFQEVKQAPSVKAAIVKSSRERIGLRLL